VGEDDSDSPSEFIGIELMVSINFLSAVKTHHKRQMKKRKNITNEITGQISMLSML
jgi:hypothetical protein